MSTAYPSSNPDILGPLRVLALALIGALPLMFVAVGFALGDEAFGADQPPVLLHVALLAGLVLSYGAGVFSVRAVQPLEPSVTGDEALAAAVNAYRTSMILRFALTESPLIALIAVVFVLEYGLWPVIVALPVGLVIVAASIYPTRTNLQRVQDRLESRGARTGFVAATLRGTR